MSVFFRWAPVVVWTALIAVMSSDLMASDQTGGMLENLIHWLWPQASTALIDGLHFYLRKAGHIFAYAILSLCWYWGVSERFSQPWRWRWVLFSLVASLFTASWDEWNQSLLPSRLGSPIDVLGYDMGGAVLMQLGLYLMQRTQKGSLLSQNNRV